MFSHHGHIYALTFSAKISKYFPDTEEVKAKAKSVNHEQK